MPNGCYDYYVREQAIIAVPTKQDPIQVLEVLISSSGDINALRSIAHDNADVDTMI